MDLANKMAVIFLGLLLMAFICWVANSSIRERRRTKAEARMRAHTDRTAAAVITDPHDLRPD